MGEGVVRDPGSEPADAQHFRGMRTSFLLPTKGGNVMHRRVMVMLAAAVMLAMMLASSGVASAAALANGKGGEMASPSAAFGIATAISNTMKHE